MTIEIPIELYFNKTLHIGSTFHESEKVDVSVVKRFENGIKTPYIPANAIKGSIRHIGFQIACQINKFPFNTKFKKLENHMAPMNELEESPFVSLFGAPDIPGKLKFSECIIKNNQDEDSKFQIRTGIRVSRETMSVEKEALFNYEMAYADQANFIISVYSLTHMEKAFLLACINTMIYSSIGGKGTSGAGIILKIVIKNKDFEKNAKIDLEKILNHSTSI